jgi:hypothetical protein
MALTSRLTGETREGGADGPPRRPRSAAAVDLGSFPSGRSVGAVDLYGAARTRATGLSRI